MGGTAGGQVDLCGKVASLRCCFPWSLRYDRCLETSDPGDAHEWVYLMRGERLASAKDGSAQHHNPTPLGRDPT